MATYNEIRARREAVQQKYGKTNTTNTVTPIEQAQIEETNKGGLFGGIGYTAEKLGLGALRSIEGITDYVVGGIADIFGEDDFTDELMKTDWVNYSHADEWYNPNGVMSFVGDVAGGVGGMLPSIGLAYATGGSSLLAQGLGTTAFGLGAAGQAVSEQAKQSGTAGGKEWLYGTLSGAAEAGIEAVSGGLGGTQAGKVLGKELAKTTAGKVATSFVGEGLEEVASDILDPALKRITGVDKEVKVEWGSLPKTFLVGGTTGAVLGGAGQVANAISTGSVNNAKAVENAQEMSERLSDNNVRQAEGKSLTYTQEDINFVRDRLSKNLQKMDEKTRASFLQNNKQIAPYFNADGTAKVFTEVKSNAQNTAYSASLQGRESTFAYQPVSMQGEVSENAKKAMRNVELLTNGKTDIVLTDQDILTADGQKANGVYKNGVLYLDARASSYDKAMFVGSHEMAHTLEGTKEYVALGEFISETIKNSPELQKKYDVNRYMAAYANAQSGNYSAETKGYEVTTEMYADFIANEILASEDTVQRLVNRNRNVVIRMLDWVRDAIKRLGMSKEDREAYNAMKKAEKLLSAALDAGRGGITLNEVEGYVKKGKKEITEKEAEKQGLINVKGDIVRYNLFTYEDGGEDILIKNLKKNGFTTSEINEVVFTMRDMAEYFRMLQADIDGLVEWNTAKVLYDEKTGKNVFTALVKNGDYPLNIDLSTICKKRKALTRVLNTLVRKGLIDSVNLSAENLVAVNDILSNAGYEVACPACFVETKRYRVDEWSNKFLDPWNELIENAVKEPQTLDFANGVYSVNNVSVDNAYLDKVIKEHTKISDKGKKSYDSIAKMAMTIKNVPQVRGFLKKSDMIGSVGLEAIKQYAPELYSRILQKGGTSTPKIIQETQPYNSELGIYRNLASKAQDVGGVRMFSFSDFTVLQTFDYLQVVADLASQKATMQTYTKEITFAELFGQTGIKINLSMIPEVDKSLGKEYAGLGKDGKPIYSKQWGVNYDDAKKLMFKEGYNGNVGTATIGISKNHILALLDDPVTNYIIPYHKSSINPTIAKMMDIDMYTDYTLVQSTRYQSGENAGKNITTTEAKKFNFFKVLAETKDARAMAQRYLDWCKENNYIPKFDEFAWHPNYYKLLVDFQVYKTVDGKEIYAPQEAVQLKLPDNFKDILKAELLKQQDISREADAKFEPTMQEIVKAISKTGSGRFSVNVDSAGNELSKEQQEYFKDSKVRDKKGNLLVVYHGTKADFNTFKKGDIGFHFGTKSAAKGRVGNSKSATIKSVYLNITNPIEFDTDLGSWNADYRLTEELFERGIITEEEAYSVLLTDNRTARRSTEAANKKLNSLLLGKGYDGIVYKNSFESKKDTISYIAFSSNQVKEIGNKNPTLNSDIRYSLDLIDNYTEKQYNDFGWARVNDVLTARENADFRSKYAKIKSGQIRANRTKNGEIIVAVNDGKDTSFGVDNVLVYAKGSLENYKINKIVRINSNNETFLTEARELVYEWERRGIQIKTSELFNVYNAEDYGYDKLMQDRRAGLQDNAQRSRKQDGRRAFGEAPRYSLNVIKSYSQADMKATVQDMEDMFVAVSGIADDYRVDVKNKNRLAKEFSEELNGNAANTNKSVEERARSFVDRVVDNLVITKNREEVAEAEGMIEALRPYYHSMDLSSIKSEILDPVDLRLWSGGEKALPWDVILQEIMEQHPQLVREDVGNTDIDTLLNVFETYQRARKVLNESRISVSKAVGNLAEVKRLMARQLSVALEEYGTQYKKERKPTYMTDEEYEERLNQSNPITDETVAGIRRVTEEPQKLSKKERIAEVKAKAAEGWLASQIEFTNVQAGIEDAGKNLGLDLKGKVQKARSARGAALNMITEAQMDYRSENVVGKSLTEIFEPIHKRGDDYTADFYEYILQWHNADRMALERKAKAEMQNLVKADAELSKIVKRKNITETEREAMLRKTANGRRYLSLAEVRNKPVFGDTVTEKDSISRRAELQTKHPEFVKLAKEVWDYNQNLLQRRVDSGLITQEMADELNKMYPHYVPTFRDMDGAPGTGRAGTKNSKYAVEVKKTIKTAKGSNLDILDISLMMANQTQAVLRAEAINELANELYEGAVAKNDFSDVAVKDVVDLTDPDVDYEAEKPKNNEVVFYKDGQRITMAVSQPVFVGFESFNAVTPFNSPVMKGMEFVNQTFKKAVTQWNPLFLIRNAVRDFQEAIFYTKNGMPKFIGNLPKAIRIMASNGKLWKQYLAMGGVASGYFNNDTGIYDPSGKVKKGVKKVSGMLSYANEFVEQIPRFNEFMLSVESGKSMEDALLDAADVTTNFSRGGKVTKAFNRTLIPFLNPSVQGWSKLWRTATGRKTAREWTQFIVKALAFGLSVGLINDLVNGDDEEYQALRTSDKENYFIIRAGEKFIKIPKGRVVAALGSVASRTKAFIEGDEKAFDDWYSSVATMISPVESASRTIFAPFGDVQTNTTWYGGAIESQRLQSLAPSERYDESTSSIAITLGKWLDYSPKKIHYLIDQYSGVIGDIILPATTAKAEKDMFSSAFIIDPVLSNGLSTEFYDLVDETTYAKNAGDPIAVLKARYLNEASNAVSDMYAQKREIESNTELKDNEKQKQTKAIQALINETLSSAIKGSTEFEQILMDSGYEAEATALVEAKEYSALTEEQKVSAARKLTDYYYAKAYAEISGGEYVQKYHLYEQIGVAKASIFLTEISAIEGDKNANGKTVTGSRKKKVQAYIQKLRLSAVQKYILLYLAGYELSEEGKAQLRRLGIEI